MDEETKYKTDKLIDYFKYIATANLAVIALFVSLKEKLKLEIENEAAPYVISIALIISLAMSYYGYYAVVNKLIEPEKNHEKIIRFCRRYSGAILISIVGVLAAYVKVT